MVLRNDLRLRHRQLEALAPHHLDQDGELQFAASHHLERIRTVGIFHTQGDVGQQFLRQTITQIARGDVLSFASRRTATYSP